MKKSRYTEEQIMAALRQVEVGRGVAHLARELGVSTATLYGWKKMYTGLSAIEAQQLKEGWKENHRLKKRVAGLIRDKEALRALIQINCKAS